VSKDVSIENRKRESASALYESKKKGQELVKHLETLDVTPSAADFCAVLLEANHIEDNTWLDEAAYGAVLKFLLGAGNIPAQVDLLYEIQIFCGTMQFPDVQKEQKALIDQLFRWLYISDMIEGDAFVAWYSDVPDISGRLEGKIVAQKQAKEFLDFLIELAKDSLSSPRSQASNC